MSPVPSRQSPMAGELRAPDRPVKAAHHADVAGRPRLRELRDAVREVEGFNAKLALAVTHVVGTMACAYAFAVIALVSLPAAIASGKVIVIVGWVAQTFLQLVLLSVIMVGQRVQAAAGDARAEQEFENTVRILDRLDTETEGGLRDVMDAVRALASAVSMLRAAGR